MSISIQLEFNINNESEEERKNFFLQQQINEMRVSIGKIQRKLFREISELKKENEFLKKEIWEMKNEKADPEWIYGQKDCLFDVSEHQKTAC